MDIDERIKKIAIKYGVESRKNHLMEEMGELIQALCKQRRMRGFDEPVDKTPQEIENDVIEEIADVYVLLMQLIYLLDEDEVYRIANEKIRRTIEKYCS